jgi:hypothetical protein
MTEPAEPAEPDQATQPAETSEPAPAPGQPSEPPAATEPGEAPSGPGDAPDEPTDPATNEPAPATPAPGTAPGWIPPEGGSGGGRRRGCIIAVIAVGIFLVLAVGGLIFLGAQVKSMLAGTMEFGTGGTGCSVNGAATTFPASTPIHAVAYLERKTTAGETLTVAVTYPDATTESSDQAIGSVADCVTQDIRPGLSPGHYGLEYRVGTEVLSKGAFDITP